jgi:hypothetical protein
MSLIYLVLLTTLCFFRSCWPYWRQSLWAAHLPSASDAVLADTAAGEAGAVALAAIAVGEAGAVSAGLISDRQQQQQ